MASYVQLGRGWRPNYQAGPFHRRRHAGRGWAATAVLVAAVFGAGLLLGRLDTRPDHPHAAQPQPMQYYPR